MDQTETERLSQAVANLVTELNRLAGSTARAAGLEPIYNQLEKEIQEVVLAMKNATSATDGFQRILNTNIGSYASLIFKLNSLNTSVYGATDAFTSIKPAVEAVSQGFQKFVDFVASSTRLLGPTLSSVFGKPIQLFKNGLQFATDALTFQIEGAQKVANAFLDVSKVGALFGASISEFYRTANRTQLPLQTLSKLYSSNAENIAKMGLGMQNGGLQVAEFTSQIVHSTSSVDQSLVALYGTVDALGEGVAEYLSLQSMAGMNLRDSIFQERLKSGAVSEYLLRQKELTALTGKSAKSFREEEEKRRMNLDYQMKVNRLISTDAQSNLADAMGLASKFFGQDGAKYLEEYFATGGKIVTEESRLYAAANQEQVKAIEFMIGSIEQTGKGFRSSIGRYFTANQPAIIAEAQSREDLAEVARVANSQFLTMSSRSGAAAIANANSMMTLEEILTKIRENRDAIAAGLDEPTKAYVIATQNNIKTQRELDTIITANMGKMGTVVEKFGILTRSLVAFQAKMFGIVMKAFDKLEDAGDDTFKSLGNVFADLLKMLEQEMRPEGQQQNPPPRAPAGGSITPDRSGQPSFVVPASPNDPQRPPRLGPPSVQPELRREASGGVVTGPTMVGEAGPEKLAGDLVFPYDRPVPIQVDWSPLIAEVQNLQNTMAELVEINDKILDTNSDMLNAVS